MSNIILEGVQSLYNIQRCMHIYIYLYACYITFSRLLILLIFYAQVCFCWRFNSFDGDAGVISHSVISLL